MNSPSTYTPSTQPAPTLLDMLGTLRQHKRLICLLSLLGVFMSVVYLVVTEPRFRARSELTPPTPTNLVHFNTIIRLLGPDINEGVEALHQSNLVELTPESAFKVFTRHLNSQHHLMRFFETVYLPYLNTNLSTQDRQQLLLQLSTELEILNANRNDVPSAEVTFSNTTPELAQEWANRFVDMALQSSRNEVLDTLRSTASLQAKITNTRIASLRHQAEADRLAQIARLNDAHELAKSIQLEQHSVPGNLITSYSGDNLYLRGTKALKAEIEILNNRKSNDPYIKSLSVFLTKSNLLSSIDFNNIEGQVASIDLRAADPAIPYQPRKLMVLSIGFIGGLLFALLFILTRLSFQFQRRNTVQGS